jgi:hypothetical protein
VAEQIAARLSGVCKPGQRTRRLLWLDALSCLLDTVFLYSLLGAIQSIKG